MATKTMGRPRARLVLTAEERDELQRFCPQSCGSGGDVAPCGDHPEV